ncbi:hypothetical protein JCM21714_765 [Gracilibacillus boraciitolerans JCM 21714]|uniref:Uncharacterized protein n=1 Tax=Gracilibacillus boraciitolerans JCM 21714 TaxID=1298598 RepID=W4VG67_9BACI|nr:hypothetical protein [Gracilibacillus boraciitolerans]GAE91808.1 hypothetical protein JCM21714_765 [Gracilibacillus boraciitolerans JCM 21714]
MHEGKVIHQNPIAFIQLKGITQCSVAYNHPLIYQSIDNRKYKKKTPLEDVYDYKKQPIFQVLS